MTTAVGKEGCYWNNSFSLTIKFKGGRLVKTGHISKWIKTHLIRLVWSNRTLRHQQLTDSQWEKPNFCCLLTCSYMPVDVPNAWVSTPYLKINQRGLAPDQGTSCFQFSILKRNTIWQFTSLSFICSLSGVSCLLREPHNSISYWCHIFIL